MKKISIAVAALGLCVLGCDKPAPTTPVLQAMRTMLRAEKGGVVHRVSVGSHDAAIFGHDDANFSLIALQKADGSMTGQWTDQFGHDDGGGLHMEVDCVSVLGHDAWISGVVTHSNVEGYPEGSFAITRVRDNGTSANDPPDQISFTFVTATRFPCTGRFNLPLLNLDGGEVKVD